MSATDDERPPDHPSQFYAVMTFLHQHGYTLRKGWDGDPAYYGGHTQRRLAELYEEERKK